MGLKKDLVNAKIQALRLAGATEPIPTEALELQVDLETSALMKFLTTCEFRITQLNAPVVLEDFKIPEQPVDVKLQTLLGDKSPLLDTFKKIPGGAALVGPLEKSLKSAVKPLLRGGSTLRDLNLSKHGQQGEQNGGLESTGYVHIGEDPDSQDAFDVEGKFGQREFTTVKLLPEDIADLL